MNEIIAKEDVRQARNADLVNYLRSVGVDLKRERGKYGKSGLPQYRVPGMGGMIVSGSMWYHFSAGEGGNAVDYLMRYMDMPFVDAVRSLLETPAMVGMAGVVQEKEKPKPKKFRLPMRAQNNHRVIGYLKKRGIPEKLTGQLICDGLLYQDNYNNCVFVCRDAGGIPLGAYLRGTGENKFTGLVEGSRREFGWRRIKNPENSPVIIAESPIDILSLAILLPERACNFNWLALNGLHLPAADKYMDDYKGISEVLIAFDNDEPGQTAAQKYSDYLERKGMDVVNFCPAQVGADINDLLMCYKGL